VADADLDALAAALGELRAAGWLTPALADWVRVLGEDHVLQIERLTGMITGRGPDRADAAR
jgi:hypothetical protein